MDGWMVRKESRSLDYGGHVNKIILIGVAAGEASPVNRNIIQTARSTSPHLGSQLHRYLNPEFADGSEIAGRRPGERR